MTFQEIRFGSEEYDRECSLREEALRAPLGLSLKDEDLSREKSQLHFGLFEPTGLLVACAAAVPSSLTDVTIRQLAVSPSRQRRGLGLRLMDEVGSRLRTDGFRNVVLDARIPAIAFYERLGYRISGDEFVEVTIPHVKMVKTI